MPKTPRFLYFDLGNVLFYFDQPRVCQQIAAVSGGLPVGDVRAFVNRYYLDLERGGVTVADVYQDFCAAFQVDPGIDAVCHAASDIFCPNTAITPLLTRLTMANRRMGILSNTSEPHWQFLQRQGYAILKLFSVAALSFELRAMKPERSAYEQAAERAGVDAGDIFFTDDRPENVEGALAAGWQAAIFTSAHDLEETLRGLGVQFS